MGSGYGSRVDHLLDQMDGIDGFDASDAELIHGLILALADQAGCSVAETDAIAETLGVTCEEVWS